MNPETNTAAVGPAKNVKAMIEAALNLLPEVMWDRYSGDVDGLVAVFGWVARHDGKSDFVQMAFDAGEIWWWGTSSAQFSREFRRRICAHLGQPFMHNDCKRVEYEFPGVRSMKLGPPMPEILG